MKKLLLTIAAVLMFVPFIQAQDFPVLHCDTIHVADTGASAYRVDTLYSRAVEIPSWAAYLWFTYVWRPYRHQDDSNFVGDTVFYALQHSFDQTTWTTVTRLGDTVSNTSADLDTVIAKTSRLNLDTANIGKYVRYRYIYRDSATCNSGMLGNIYYMQFNSYMTARP